MKSWYESKTIWLGLATIVTAVVSAVAGGAGWQQAVLAAVGAANIFLRTQTTKPLLCFLWFLSLMTHGCGFAALWCQDTLQNG